MDDTSELGEPDPREVRLAEAVEAFEAQLRAGASPTVDDWCERYPEVSEDLQAILPSLMLMESVAKRVTEEVALEEAVDSIPEAIGDYRVVRRLGRGGMGVVYLAVQESMGREVALKVLPTNVDLDAGFLERFQREAQAAGRLSHPHVVPVYGVGFADGRHYFAMRYIDGHSLDEIVARLRQVEAPARSAIEPSSQADSARSASSDAGDSDSSRPGAREAARAVQSLREGSEAQVRPLTVPGAVRIVLQVVEALAHAHASGVLHRDIKPGNILLDSAGAAWVTDFGLCRIEDAGNLTSEGAILGTLRYMAPEQIDGASDERSDVYAAGLVLFELIALRPAFDSTRRARVIHDVQHLVPPRLRKFRPSVPRELETIVKKATAKLPDERYASAAAFARDLQAFLESRPITARRPSALYLGRLFVTRHKLASLVAVVALLLLATLAALYVRDLRASRRTSERNAYVGALVAAEAALRDGSIQRAKHHLRRAPERFRAWEWAHLEARVDQALHARGMADVAPTQVVADPTGQRAAVVGLDGVTVVTLPGLEAEEQLGDAAGTALAWSQSGRTLAVMRRDGGVDVYRRSEADRRFEVASRIRPGTFQHEASAQIAVAGDLVLIGTEGGALHLWDFERWSTMRLVTLPGSVVGLGMDVEEGSPRWWAASSTGAIVLGAGGSPRDPAGTNTRGAQARFDLALGGDTLTAAAMDADRPGGVASTLGGVIYDFDLDRAVGGDVPLRRIFGANRAIDAIALDGGLVYAVGRDKLVHVIDRASRGALRSLSGSPHPLRSVALSHADGGVALTLGHDGVLRAWDREVAGGSLRLGGHVDEVSACAAHPDGRLLATGGRDGLVIVWDLERTEPVACFFEPAGAIQAMTFVAPPETVSQELETRQVEPQELALEELAPTASELVAVTADGTLHAWSLPWDTEGAVASPHRSAPIGRTGVRDLVYDGQRDVLLLACSDGLARAAVPGREARDLPEDWLRGRSLAAVAIDAERDRVVSVTTGGEVVALDAADGRLLFDVPTTHAAGATGVALAPRLQNRAQRLGVFATTNHGVVVFDGSTGALQRTLIRRSTDGEQGERLVGATFSPDGRRVLATTANGLLSVWDVRTGEHLVDLRGHAFGASRIIRAGGSGHVVTVAADESTRVWSTDSTRVLDAARGEALPLLKREALDRVRSRLRRDAMLDSIWVALQAGDDALPGAMSLLADSLYRRDPTDPLTAALFSLARDRVTPTGENRALMEYALVRLRPDDPRCDVLRRAIAGYDRARLLADTTLIRGDVEAARLRPNPNVQRALVMFSSFVPWGPLADLIELAAPAAATIRTLRRRLSGR